ncbi:pfs domain-containing protein [Verticillium alfalfae VaMs.102]|uniref:Pfs domain-containing protein n=1 Tax=Verticillium alfalfae (strain VaMs.102 / ATCC MYA-4576 / FGSC 10136) TaxID=526221 RepID=C9SIP2_VERA1|nr:pfs domain-containing protein [Verticillium alfalfae VaMs.102]EEY18815.1 pfs domain-containing protein [Verticillium alfalfae VaMs.102]
MADPDVYTVGWICALVVELVAAKAFLDKVHDDPERLSPNDTNTYSLGEIGGHNIVIAALPTGDLRPSAAAVVAMQMQNSFPNIQFCLSVGTAGGAPSPKNDIRLGDVIVSCPRGTQGGVFQYDSGRRIQDERFEFRGHLNKPPCLLQTVIGNLEARYQQHGHNLDKAAAAAAQRLARGAHYRQPPKTTDRLFLSTCTHPSRSNQSCSQVCDTHAGVLQRRDRDQADGRFMVHYGLVASGSRLVRDAAFRDNLVGTHDVLCFEMQAAGLMNALPCLVVRGISNYSDTHKNDEWQGFAAMMAAAYAADLLREVPSIAHRREVDRVWVLDSGKWL